MAQAFVKMVKEKYKVRCPDHDFSQAYETAQIIKQALTNAKLTLTDASLKADRARDPRRARQHQELHRTRVGPDQFLRRPDAAMPRRQQDRHPGRVHQGRQGLRHARAGARVVRARLRPLSLQSLKLARALPLTGDRSGGSPLARLSACRRPGDAARGITAHERERSSCHRRSSGAGSWFARMHPIVPWLIACVVLLPLPLLSQQRLHAVRRQRDGDQHHPRGRPEHRQRLRRTGHGRPYRPDGDRRLCVGRASRPCSDFRSGSRCPPRC